MRESVVALAIGIVIGAGLCSIPSLVAGEPPVSLRMTGAQKQVIVNVAKGLPLPTDVEIQNDTKEAVRRLRDIVATLIQASDEAALTEKKVKDKKP